MNIIKRIILIVIIGLTLTGCNEYLEEELYSPTDQYLKTEDGLEYLVNTCYERLREIYGREPSANLTVHGTDIFMKGKDNTENALNDYLGLDSQNGTVNHLWVKYYQSLNECNTFLSNIEDATFSNPIRKEELEGEVRFLRAHILWRIVETWGGVSLSTKPSVEVKTTAERSPVDDFYEVIFDDLEIAIDKLPQSVNQTEKYGRLTKGAAEAFIARMHLTRKNYDEAASYAKNVINNYDYSLVNVADLWIRENERNKEIIFNVNYTDNQNLNSGGMQNHAWFQMWFDRYPGLTTDLTTNAGYARYMPTKFYVELYDQDNDGRWKHWWRKVWYANLESTLLPEMNIGDTALYLSIEPLTQSYRDLNKERMTMFDINDLYNQDEIPDDPGNFFTLIKFLDNQKIDGQDGNGTRDVPIIRLAEVYLILAEAELLGNNNPNAAASALNEIRTRAALPGKEELMKIRPADVTLDFILDERARELGGEQLRWFDLKRTGKLIERTKAYNPYASPYIKEYHALRPISQQFLDGIRNPEEFGQNNGY